MVTMKRILITIALIVFAFIASAQYIPAKNNYGNYNVYGSQWIKSYLLVDSCVTVSDTTTTEFLVVDTAWVYYIDVDTLNADSIVTKYLRVTDTAWVNYISGDTASFLYADVDTLVSDSVVTTYLRVSDTAYFKAAYVSTGDSILVRDGNRLFYKLESTLDVDSAAKTAYSDSSAKAVFAWLADSAHCYNYWNVDTLQSCGTIIVINETMLRSAMDTLTGDYAASIGGRCNNSAGDYSFMGGGYYNKNDDVYSGMIGGRYGLLQGQYAFIGGGYADTANINSDYGGMVGGYENHLENQYSFMGGGYQNTNTGINGGMISGQSNYNQGTRCVMLGGITDTIISGVTNSVTLGGTKLYAIKSNTAYMQNAHVTDTLHLGDMTFLTYSDSLADDDSVNFQAGISGMGRIYADTVGSGEYLFFSFRADGSVTLQANVSANTAGTDSNGKLCVIDRGAFFTVKNRLGGTRKVKIVLEY